MGSRNSKQDQERRPSPNTTRNSIPTEQSQMRLRRNKPCQPPRQTTNPIHRQELRYFAGNMLFFLRGLHEHSRKTSEHHNIHSYCSTCGTLFAFSAPWLWHHVSAAIPIISLLLLHNTLFVPARRAIRSRHTSKKSQPHPPNPDEDRDGLVSAQPQQRWVIVKTFPSTHKSPLPGHTKRLTRSRPKRSPSNGSPNRKLQKLQHLAAAPRAPLPRL